MQLLELKEVNITKIALAVFVSKDGTTKVHKNRPYHGFALNKQGDITYNFSGKKYTVHQGELIYLPKHSDYTVEDIDLIETGCYAVNFDIDSDDRFEPFVFNTKGAYKLYEDAFEKMSRLWQKKQTGYYFDTLSVLAQICADMQKENSREYISKASEKTVHDAISYISEHYTDAELKVGDVSAYCKVSEVYLRRLFARSVRISPNEYITSMRMDMAAQLIGVGGYSVSKAAEASGFGDISYFSREFKKRYGVSPSQMK